MDRRKILQGGLLLAAAANASSTQASASIVNSTKPFPKSFTWGCATAAYQIEGGVGEDGRGLTNWDVFSHSKGRIADNSNGDVACDSYHRYLDDIALLKSLGVSAYRMSIAWSRIFPEGRGKVNQKGVDYYNRVVDALLQNGITPYVTLFHWDLPEALPGGWQNRDTAYAYAEYAGYVSGALSDRVRHFITTNEIFCFTDLGHSKGIHAPGLQLEKGAVNQVRHNGLMAHGLGVQAVRAQASTGTLVGMAENTSIFVPAIETPEHIEAAKKATRHENAMFTTAIMEGRYLDSYLEREGKDAPQVASGDMAIIGSELDFQAINVYAPTYVMADDSKAGYHLMQRTPSSPHMASPWLYVGPEALYWAVRISTELWHPKRIYISENGASADDVLHGDHVDDGDRIMYLRNYITHLQRAVSEGYPVEAYFLWSLMDNFEWADGYTKRFGIHYVDFATQVRTPKMSALWYRELIRRGALV